VDREFGGSTHLHLLPNIQPRLPERLQPQTERLLCLCDTVGSTRFAFQAALAERMHYDERALEPLAEL
jgi:hypothetical protein